MYKFVADPDAALVGAFFLNFNKLAFPLFSHLTPYPHWIQVIRIIKNKTKETVHSSPLSFWPYSFAFFSNSLHLLPPPLLPQLTSHSPSTFPDQGMKERQKQRSLLLYHRLSPLGFELSYSTFPANPFPSRRPNLKISIVSIVL